LGDRLGALPRLAGGGVAEGDGGGFPFFVFFKAAWAAVVQSRWREQAEEKK